MELAQDHEPGYLDSSSPLSINFLCTQEISLSPSGPYLPHLFQLFVTGSAIHSIQFHAHIIAFIHSSFLQPPFQYLFIEDLCVLGVLLGAGNVALSAFMKFTVQWGRQREYTTNYT